MLSAQGSVALNRRQTVAIGHKRENKHDLNAIH